MGLTPSQPPREPPAGGDPNDATGGRAVLRTYTCVQCGHRSMSWAAFRAHRQDCQGRARAASGDPASDPAPDDPTTPGGAAAHAGDSPGESSGAPPSGGAPAGD